MASHRLARSCAYLRGVGENAKVVGSATEKTAVRSHTDRPNRLYYGDNLDVLRRYIRDETVDLIYLDPPFNSRREYNVIFKERSGAAAASQQQAFLDSWDWPQAADTYAEIVSA